MKMLKFMKINVKADLELKSMKSEMILKKIKNLHLKLMKSLNRSLISYLQECKLSLANLIMSLTHFIRISILKINKFK